MSDFNIGDTVRVLYDVYGCHYGSEGTVVKIHTVFPPYIEVAFGNSHKTWLFEPRELELVQ